jgi:hypothetical protein
MNAKILLVATVAFLVPHCANGQVGCFGGPYAPCWGYGYGGYSTYCTESVPYYSLNPPVYYSYRVARTYGYGPFAYPPGVLTPGSESPRPATVRNVYAPTEEVEAAEASPPKPLRIVNPFVEQPGKAAKGTKPASHRPHVVYPASLARHTSATR